MAATVIFRNEKLGTLSNFDTGCEFESNNLEA